MVHSELFELLNAVNYLNYWTHGTIWIVERMELFELPYTGNYL